VTDAKTHQFYRLYKLEDACVSLAHFLILCMYVYMYKCMLNESQLQAGLCQQVGDVPAAPAEPVATANPPAEVASFVCLLEQDA